MGTFELEIEVIQAQYLLRTEQFGPPPDTSVKVSVDQQKRQKKQTKVVKRSNYPVWKEAFTFRDLTLEETVYIRIVVSKGLFTSPFASCSLQLHEVLSRAEYGSPLLLSQKLYQQNEGVESLFVGQITLALTVCDPGVGFPPASTSSIGAFSQVSGEDLPQGWETRRDEHGRRFYFHPETRSRSSERPSLSLGSGASLRSPSSAPSLQSISDSNLSSSHSGSILTSLPKFLVTRRISNRTSSDSDLHPRRPSHARHSSQGARPAPPSLGVGPLPPGWEERRTEAGTPYFVNHADCTTQWEDPRLSVENRPRSRILSGEGEVVTAGMGPLPRGWEERFTKEGTPYYVDHLRRKTQWEDPRLKGHVDPHADAPKYIRDYQQKLEKFRKGLRLPEDRPKLEIKVRRGSVYEESMREVMAASPGALKNRLWVSFEGEEGLDYGGVAKEWFFLLSKELFNPARALFQYSASDNYSVQISSSLGGDRSRLLDFQFAGRIMGMAVFHGHFIDAFFVPSFYKTMLGQHMGLEDLASIDVERYNSMRWMLENDITGVLFETFSVVTTTAAGEETVHELRPGGGEMEVTEGNKREYVELYLRWRSYGASEVHLASLLRGFHELIPRELLGLFDAKELEYLIAGLSEVDVEDWKRHTLYKNCDEGHKTVRWFWVFVQGLSRDLQARLIQFVTGTSRIPPAGFRDLCGSDGPRLFCIEIWGTQESLPRSHTCFNRLDLPPYETYQQLHEKLMYAIEHTAGFGLE